VVDIGSILGHVVTIALSVGLGSFGGRWLVDRDLERRRAQLRLETESRLETFRAELAAQRSATDSLQQELRDERQARFSILQDRRSAAMQDVYTKILELRDAMFNVAIIVRGQGGNLKQAIDKSADAGLAYRMSYRQARLYFPRDLADELHELNEIAARFHNAIADAVAAGLTNNDVIKSIEHIDTSRVPMIADDIADRFRKYFGADQFD
jgi:hypothetical protein